MNLQVRLGFIGAGAIASLLGAWQVWRMTRCCAYSQEDDEWIDADGDLCEEHWERPRPGEDRLTLEQGLGVLVGALDFAAAFGDVAREAAQRRENATEEEQKAMAEDAKKLHRELVMVEISKGLYEDVVLPYLEGEEEGLKYRGHCTTPGYCVHQEFDEEQRRAESDCAADARVSVALQKVREENE